MKSLGCDVVHHSPIATMAVPLVMVAERERERERMLERVSVCNII